MRPINKTGVNAMDTKQILYKDDKKDDYHVYTPEELERLNEIALLRRKAISLYELALELLERAETASRKGNLSQATDWNTKAHECELRGRIIEKESLDKKVELYLDIGRVEGWKLPEGRKVGH
jgi:DNA-binding transcriptional MerR regulator